MDFEEWIEQLREAVIQDDYGYEEGEFTVYPEAWRPLYNEGLTPDQAFKRALDAHAETCREGDAERAANYTRIVETDRKLFEGA